MPAPGDQHRETSVTANPFAPPAPRLGEWTAREIATLQGRLEKQLGPEFISTRPGPSGGKVHYLAAEKVINLANDVFGFNGWSSSIQNVQVDFVDEHTQTGKITLGLSTVVRVTLRDGTYHEDIGYGHIENCKGKAAAFEKAKKEAVTDALKRALRNFGNMLGNCLYDKDYLQKVTRMKVRPTKWDEDSLHRHSDFAPAPAPAKREACFEADEQPAAKIQRTATFEDDFESNMFDDLDFAHTDDTRKPDQSYDSPTDNAPTRQQQLSKPAPVAHSHTVITPQSKKPLPSGNGTDASNVSKQVVRADTPSRQPPSEQWQAPLPQETPADAPSGFITGKAVDLLDKPPEARPPLAQLAFDPHHESPGLRRTQGVNPGKSAPVKLSALGRAIPDPSAGSLSGLNGPAVSVKTNFVNPANDPSRRVGMPPVAPNRGAYKPPTAVKRPPLADMSNLQQPEPVTEMKKTATSNDTGNDTLVDSAAIPS